MSNVFELYLKAIGGCPCVDHKPESCVSMALSSAYHFKHKNHLPPQANVDGWINKHTPTNKIMYECCKQAIILHVVKARNLKEELELYKTPERRICPGAPKKSTRILRRKQGMLPGVVLFP